MLRVPVRVGSRDARWGPSPPARGGGTGAGPLCGSAPQHLGVQEWEHEAAPPGCCAPASGWRMRLSLHGWCRNWGWELRVRFDAIPSSL